MPSYNASQRSSIAQFVSFTSTKESIAGRFLKTHGWNVEQAVDAYYHQTPGGNNVVAPSQTSLNKLFDQYRDKPIEQPDTIGIEGAQRYLSDLGIALDEVVHLALCDLLQCPSIGEFTRENFVSGWRSLSSPSPSINGTTTTTTANATTQTYDTIPKQSAHITTLRKRLASDPAYFKEIYRSTFRLAKPENQKSVPMDAALEFWQMFFGGRAKGGVEWNSRRTPWLDWWLEFYETRIKRPVNKDLWNMVMELVSKTKEDDGESLDWWSENGAWPMAVDEFVEFVKERRKASTLPAGGGGGQVDVMDTS